MAGISATNLGVLKQFVAPGTGAACKGVAGSVDPVNGVNIPVAILPIAAPNFQNNKFWYVSGDWNISQTDQFRVRYVDNNLAVIDTNATLPAFFLPVPTTNNLFTMSEYHTFTLRLATRFVWASTATITPHLRETLSTPGWTASPTLPSTN